MIIRCVGVYVNVFVFVVNIAGYDKVGFVNFFVFFVLLIFEVIENETFFRFFFVYVDRFYVIGVVFKYVIVAVIVVVEFFVDVKFRLFFRCVEYFVVRRIFLVESV